MDPITILLWVLIVLFIYCVVQLTRIARSKHLPNLYWLAANFGFAALANLSPFLIPSPLPNIIGLIASAICSTMFVQQTMYRDRKSPYLLVIGLVLVFGGVQIWFTFNPAPGMTLTYIGYMVVWGWQALVSFQAWRNLVHDRTVEDWVKTRYLLWMAYTTIMFVLCLRILIPVQGPTFEGILSTSLVIGVGFIQFLTWAMPEPFRLWLNRNYKPVVPQNLKPLSEMTEAELLQQIRS